MKRMDAGSTHCGVRDLEAVASGGLTVRFTPAARARVRRARDVVEAGMRRGDVMYGVNTGFGELVHVRIPAAEGPRLQENLVRSHATGVGERLSREESRALLALRAHALARGHSGVRPALVDALLKLLSSTVVPVIPLRGSVGASGDLAPLAHLALVLLGEGEAWVGRGREPVPGALALRRAGLKPIRLAPKEGLSLINGTQLMCGVGALAWCRCERVLLAAEMAAAMSVESLLGSVRPFDARFFEIRPHPGHAESARHLRSLLRGSGIVASHRNCGQVQDAYSERCVPQVLGAVRDALRFAKGALEIEMNAVTDNPVLLDGELMSGGNFHGQPVASALDFMAIALAQLAGFSERRTYRLLDARLSGLPAFLAGRPGLESGLMLVQYTAAALVTELKVLSHPASVDSIPTSAGQEDHVSMGSVSATKLRTSVALAAGVVAAELLTASRAMDLRAPLRPAPGTLAVRKAVRRLSSPYKVDRPLGGDLDRIAESILDGTFTALADSARSGIA